MWGDFRFRGIGGTGVRPINTVDEWQPFEVTRNEFLTYQELITHGYIELKGRKFLSAAGALAFDPDKMVSRFKEMDLVTISYDIMRLVELPLMGEVLEGGRYFIGDNVSGRFDTWLSKEKKLQAWSFEVVSLGDKYQCLASLPLSNKTTKNVYGYTSAVADDAIEKTKNLIRRAFV